MLKFFGRRAPGNVEGVGSSSAESRSPGSAVPTTMKDAISSAHPEGNLYSTEGSIDMKVVADPTDAVLEYVPTPSC